MTDYVISEEQLVELDACQHMTEMALVRFLNHIRSRPLSEAIAEHNADVIKELERLENYMVDHCVDTSAVSYHKAITLIRDGVKRDG